MAGVGKLVTSIPLSKINTPNVRAGIKKGLKSTKNGFRKLLGHLDDMPGIYRNEIKISKLDLENIPKAYPKAPLNLLYMNHYQRYKNASGIKKALEYSVPKNKFLKKLGEIFDWIFMDPKGDWKK